MQQIQARWKLINADCQKYAGIYNRVKHSTWGSRNSEKDIQARASRDFRTQGDKNEQQGKEFKFMGCWQVLRFCPKWKGEPTIPIARRHGYNKSSKQSDDHTIHIVDEDNEVQELPRPPGRDSRHRKGKSVGSSSTRATEYLEQLSHVHSRFEKTTGQVTQKLDSRAVDRVELNTLKEHILDCRQAGKEKRAARLEKKYFKLIDEYHGISSDDEDE